MKELKTSELKALREKWYDEQNGIDPVLKKYVDFEKTVIDHMHTNKNEEPCIETGRGFCRGCIDRDVNAFEGRVKNAYNRSGLKDDINLPTLLRNLADYLESNRINEEIIHPNSVVKKRLTKRSYNKLKKAYDGKKAFPKYSGKLTKPLERLFEEYGIEPEYY